MIALGVLAVLGAQAVATDLGTERDLHQVEHVTSGECRRCHADHYASWARTFHRTMTQEASEGAVLGDFEGASLEYGGVTATMAREDGGFVMTFAGAGGVLGRAAVERTVGSRRVQQYLAREGDVYYRLPLAWHVEEQRWMHMNGAFLTPDPALPEGARHVSLEDYQRHVTRWNDNCIFCHNVAPDPGLDASAERWTSSVAELGIACGACHGPGEEHVRRNADPMRRYALHLSDDPDPTIVSPRRLSPERSAEVCGRCHGQRITGDIARFLEDGDPFVPGERLAHYSRPLARDTSLGGDREAFAARFWKDGTPRLTAYEYQGLLQSPCTQGGMTCTSCHGMHEGDPRGQLRPSAAGDLACTGCHGELAGAGDARAHSGHRDVRCADCHMPRVVYGIVDVHRSHRIESPDPAREAASGRPDACTLCHADRSLGWAAAEHARLWPAARAEPPPARELPHAHERALAGDPIERAVACAALGRTDALEGDLASARRLGILLEVMANDPYPAVRRIAWRSARALAGEVADWRGYEPTAAAAERERWVVALASRLGGGVIAPDPAIARELRDRAANLAIEIGE